MRLQILRVMLLVTCTLLGASKALGVCVEEPQDYRETDFRAPTPCTIAGGRVVSTTQVQRLIAEHAAVPIDVLPSPRRPDNLPEGTVWKPRARQNIPESVWLANTGFGVLPVEEEVYFREHLARLTADDPDRPLIFYCLAECWMSWNAAKRAIAYGYSSVLWFPEGTDGWAAAGLPVVDSAPVPLGDH